MRKTRSERSWLNKPAQTLLVIWLACLPGFAAADWSDTVERYGNDFRLALYAFGGILAVGSLVWSAIRWQVARMNGDRSHGFMDYFQDVVVITVAGGSMVLAAAAWQIFGSGAPV